MMSETSDTSRQSASVSAPLSSLTFPANLRLALAMILPIAILLLVLIAMDSAWLHPASAAGTVRYVATTGVDTGSCTSSASPCRTAHYAVGVAQSGDEVRVAQGTYTDVHSVGALTQVVYISRSLVLRGGYSTADWINNYITRPTVLDARTLGRTIYITNNVTATVEGFSLTGGLAASGGGIYLASGTSLVQNNRIYGNSASGAVAGEGGGGIYVASGSPAVQNNVIYSNTAAVRGGGVALVGGSFLIANNIIYSNTVSGGDETGGGGGIYAQNSYGTIRGNAIYSNTVPNEGGGIHFDGRPGTLTLEQNDIHHNSAGNRGGGMYVRQGVHSIRNNLVYSNTALAVSGGGGFNLRSTYATAENNTFYGNTNSGIYVDIGTPVGYPTLRNNISAYNNGYGIYAGAGGPNDVISVTYSLVWGNSISELGGKTVADTGTITQNPQLTADFHLQPNSPAINAADPISFASNDYAGYGRPFGTRADMGAYEYYAGSCFARINGAGQIYTDVQPAVNVATYPTDTVRVAGLCQGVSAIDVGGSLLTQTLLLTKSLTVQGGYTVTDWVNSYPTVRPTTLDAQGLGRVVYISATNPVTLDSLRLTNGNAGLAGGTYVGLGGGLYVLNGTVTLSNATVASNSATDGGGLYNSNGALTIRRTGIYSNTATSGDGGGIYNLGSVIMEANRVYANSASGNGGGVYHTGTVATLQNNMIYTNTASQGGGVYGNATGPLSVANNTFYANRATDRGGALGQASGAVYVTNTLLISNTAVVTAGAVYVGGGTTAMDYNDLFGNAPNNGYAITGTHSLAKDPAFANLQIFDLHLMPGSLVIDAGLFLPSVTNDIDGDVRPLGNGFDMGADEQAPNFTPDYSVAGLPGSTVVYTHFITNTSSVADTFTFAHSNSASGWSVTPPSTVTLGAGASQNVYASVVVPTGYLSGTNNTTIITATSQNYARSIGLVVDTTYVARVVGVMMTANLSSTMLPGETYTYTHWVTNTGNYTDTFLLTLNGPWGGFVTTPTIPPGAPMYVTLGPGLTGYTNSQQIVLTVTVPLTAPAFMASILNVVATSQADGVTQAMVTDTTTAKATVGDRYVHTPGVDVSDLNNNCTQSRSPCATVQHAVEQASDGDTVKVAEGTYAGGELRINKNIFLMGGYDVNNWGVRDPVLNVTRLDGGSTSRVIYIPGFGLAPTIDGFTIQNGWADGVGGGLYIEISASPTLRNVTFINNRADSKGGAIYINGGSLYLDRVSFTGNTATRGAGLYNVSATLTFSGTQFLANGDAATLEGGGLYNAGGSLTINSHSVIQGNTANTGGGIYHVGGGLVITNSRIVTNSATSDGGGLYSGGGAGTLFNNVVLSNTASGNGGGLYFATGDITFANNTLYGNVVTGTGGGLYLASATAMITNNIIANNAAGTSGFGGLDGSATTTADYNDFWNNTPSDADVPLGAHSIIANPLFQNVSTGDFSLTDFSPAVDKGDPNTQLSYDYAYNPRPAGQGYDMGAYELGGCYARVNHWGVDGPIHYNIQDAIDAVQVYTDVVKVAGTCRGVHPLQVGPATIYQAVHITQTFILRGGYSASIWNDPPQGLPAVINAQSRGRGIYISGAIEPFIEGFVLMNGAAAGLGGGPGSQDAGGALYNSGSRTFISGTAFYNSSATFGGGLYNGNGGVITLTQSTLGGNAASQSGGGLYNYDGNLIVGSTTITGNAAGGGGGGGFNSQYGTLTISRTSILSNTAATGGGLYNDFGTATLQSDIIRDNTSSGNGGGLYIAGGSVTAQNSMIYNNTAATGAGTYMSSGNLNTSFNTWYNNTASGDGGAIYKGGGSLSVNNSILISNTASNGSSIYNGSGSATLDYNDVSPATVQGVVSWGGHDFFADPWFVDPAGGNLHLRDGSPAMDKGDPSATLTFDLDGDIRPSMFGIDVGADEIGGCYVRLNNGTTTYGSLPKVIAMSTSPSDIVKIAGRCVGVQAVLGGGTYYTQSVYLTKTLTLRGGYSPTNWIISDPYASPTYIDAVNLGRVVVVTGTAAPTLDGLILSNGSAAQAGGVNAGGIVYVLGGSPTLSTTWLISGTAQYGGGLYNAIGTVTVRNSVVATNTATNYGGGLNNNNGILTVRRSEIYRNSAASGGAIYNAATLLAQGNKIYTNTATSGGGVYNSVNSAKLENNMMYANSATDGGAVSVAGGSVTVNGNTLYRNRATGRGGGLYSASGTSTFITNTIVMSNTAGAGSYGIHIPTSGATYALDYNDVLGNTPQNSSVSTGLHSLSVDPLFVDASQYDLHIRPNSPMIDKGDPATQLTEDFEGDPRPGMNGFDIGADELGNCLALNARTGVLYGSVQRAHDAALTGDVIKLAGYCWGVQSIVAGGQTYTQTLYINKPVTFRGGYTATNWIAQYPISQPTTLDARGLGRVVYVSSTVQSTLDTIWLVNGKAAQGGGLYNLNSPLVLSHTTFFSNTTTGNGGAIYNNNGQPTLIGNTIYSNTATGLTSNGGGFYNLSGNPTFNNNVIYSNTATIFGGGIHVESGTATVVNNTLSANRAALGGGVYNTGGGLNLVNTILVSNTATTMYGGLHDAGSGSRVDYDLWWGNLPNDSSVATGTHSLTANPTFVNASAGDFHLELDSPAIDTGDPNTLLSLDMDNEPRPMQYTFDIGADEYAGCYARLNHLGYDYPIVYNVQEAIDAATLPTDTVKVAGNCWGVKDIGGARQVAYINKSLILRGGYSLSNWTNSQASPFSNLTVLDARERGRVIYVGPYTVTVDGFDIENGDASNAGLDATVGGGVYNNGGNLTLHDALLTLNTAMWGGGLYVNGGRVFVTNDALVFNLATRGGGIYINGGRVDLDGNPTATCDLESNIASSEGGAVYVSNNGYLRLIDTVGWMCRNTAAVNGGGFYVASGSLDFSTYYWFYRNTATNGSGGGVYVGSAGDITFTAQGGLDSYRFEGNVAGTHGGGLYSDGGIVNMLKVILTNNQATNGNGGGIYQTGAGRAAIYNALAISNTAPLGSGGAFYNENGSLKVINGTIVSNTAYNAGGGLYSASGSMTVTNTILVGNAATAPTSSGGGIRCAAGICWESYNDFWNNSAIQEPDHSGTTGGFGDINADPQFVDPVAPDPNFQWAFYSSGYKLRHNSPAINTGTTAPEVLIDAENVSRPQGVAWDMGRYEFPFTAQVHVSDSTLWADPGQTVVHWNTVTNQGSMTDTFTLSISGPWLTGTFPSATPPLGPGQSWSLPVTVTVPLTATICDSSTVTITATSTNVPAASDRGTDRTQVNIVMDMTLTPDLQTGSARPGETITYTHVLSNNVNTCGPGGFYVTFNNSQYSWSPLSEIITLTTGTTTTIVVPIHIYTWAPVNVVDQATIKASLVISPALFVIAGDNTTILPAPATRYVTPNGADNSNCSDRDHGACATVQYAVNQAAPGDEVRVTEGTYTGTLYIGKTVNIQGGYTNTNWSLPPAPARQHSILDAQSAGRVISMSGSITPTVSGFTIRRGIQADGAGVYVDAISTTLSSNVIAGNTATNNGGGIYVRAGNMTLQNTIVYNDFALNGGGGGVYVNGGTATLENNTFYNNSGTSGGAVYNATGATTRVTNTIVANNTTSGGGSFDIYNAGVTLTMDYADMWNDSSNVPTGTNSITADPLFANPASGDFHLTASSPAIDRGTTLADVNTDYEGDSRPQISAYDIGVDELLATASLQLTPAADSRNTTSSPIYYQHVLTNAGNYTDTVTLSYSVDQPGWTVSISPDPTVMLGVGQATTVWVTVTVPGGALTGTVGIATITATSSISTAMAVLAVDTTYYQEDSNLAIAKHVTPASGWLGPGSPVTYTLVYSTSGPSPAVGAILTDIVPVTLTNVQVISSGVRITATSGITYVWNVEQFGIGQVGYITITGQVKTLAQGLSQIVAPITNTAIITSVQRDVGPADNTSAVTSWLDSAPPNVPGNALLSPSNGTMTMTQAITFTWKPFDDRYFTTDGSGVVSHQLVISSVQGTAYYTNVTVISPTTFYSVANLPFSTAYTWTVRAFDAVGNASNWAPASMLTIGRPVLSVSKQASPGAIRGLPLTYTINISNTGLIPATSVVVTDALPANAIYISGGDLFDSQTITWTNITVGPLNTVPARFVVSTCQVSLTNASYRVASSAEGISSTLGAPLVTALANPTIVVTFTQSASILPANQTLYLTGTATTNGGPIITYGWSFGDGQTATGSTTSHVYTWGGTFTIRLTVTDTCGLTAVATRTVQVIAPSLGLSKTGPETAGAGSPVFYTIVASNTGLDDLHNVVLTDTLPAFIMGGYATPAPVGGNGTIVASASVTWNVGTLTVGNSYSVTLVVTVTSPLDNGTVITNTARARSAEMAPPPVAVTTTVLSSPWLELTKRTPGPVWVGSPLTYTIRYTNTGNANAPGVVLTDALPSNITSGYAVPPQSSGSIGANQVITWNLDTVVGAGGNGSITLTVIVTPVLPNGTVLTNTARIASPAGVSAATGPVTTTVYSAPRFGVTKSNVPSGLVSLGDRITYTLWFTNTGSEDAMGVTITDVTPISTTFVSAGIVAPATGTVNSPAQGGTGPVIWNLTSPIVVGGSASVTFTAQVTTSPLYNNTPIVNSAYTVTAQNTVMPATGNAVTNTVRALPSWSITKSAPASVVANTLLTYTIRYTNTGSGNAAGVIVTDALPSNISGGYAIPMPSSGVIAAGQVVTWIVPNVMGQGGTGPAITLVVTPTQSFYGTLLNVAGITCSDGVNGTTPPVIVAATHSLPVSLAISPQDATVRAGFTQTYTVTGTDTFGNVWNATSEVTFTSSSGGAFGGISPGNNVFTAMSPLGTHVITATASNGQYITTTVNVALGTATSMWISPRGVTVVAGQTVVYSSVITDAYNNTGDGTSQTTFTAEGSNGFASNSFTGNVLSATVAGTWTITGTSGSALDTTYITILPGPVARLSAGSTTTQTAGVGFTVAFTARDAFNNAVTDFASPLTLADSTGTLTPTSWNVWSGGVATAFVTVTRATAGDLITATVVATPTLSAVAGPFAVVPNVPAVAALQITPANIPLGATGNLTATFWDAYTNLVANGTVVTFTTTAGTFANGLTTYTDTTTAGLTTAVLTAGCTPGAITLSARAGAALTQTSASFVTPGLPASISVALQSNSVPVGGVTTPITATVRDCGNYLLGDGTSVTFSIGPIAAAIAPNPATTTGGLAPATLTSPQMAGTSVITATSGAAQGQATITFTPLEPYTVTVVAARPFITPTDSSNIQATVVDRYNNAVANGTTVNFAATLGTVSPASANTASGLASTVFTAGSVEGRAIVTATTGTGVWGTTAITITTGRTYVYLPLVMRNYTYVPGKNLIVTSIQVTPGNPAATTVVIQNTGNTSVTEGFYVALYLDPTSPIQINRFWQQVGSPYGIVWGVTTPILPGATLTLTPTSPFVTPGYTSWPASFSTGGHNLWAQVDVYGSGTTGLVPETNESDNIAGPVPFTAP